MANKKKGQLTASSEWAKHLRKYLKKQFWKSERKAENKEIEASLFETDNLMWQFEELVKTLIAMSMPLEFQKNYYGIGVASDEMAGDFYSYYTLNKSRYKKRGLIIIETKELLDNIEKFLESWSNEKDEEFWYEMDKHEVEWDLLRSKAKNTLNNMNKSNLTIEVNHENEYDKNGNVVSQKTKTKLIEK